MAKISRVYQRIFGSNAPVSGNGGVGKFGSLSAGSPTLSTSVSTIQSLGAWLDGWLSSIVGDNGPPIEDMNGFCYVVTTQLAYLLQAGVAEWDTTTVYYIGSLAQAAGIVYASITDGNTGNALSDTANWKVICKNPYTTLGDVSYSLADGVPERIAGNITTTTKVLAQKGTGAVSAAPSWVSPVPTVQILTGSGTWTRPTGCVRIEIEAIGGGAGGAGSGDSGTGGNGATATNTTFGSGPTLVTAGGGAGAIAGNNFGGAGGGTIINSPAVDLGSFGGGAGGSSSNGPSIAGGNGGSSSAGGAGSGGPGSGPSGSVGIAATAGSGSGGGGAGAGTNGPDTDGGAGGGSGATTRVQINLPAASYPFVCGAKGVGGTAGTNGAVGGDGADGKLIVREFYI